MSSPKLRRSQDLRCLHALWTFDVSEVRSGLLAAEHNHRAVVYLAYGSGLRNMSGLQISISEDNHRQ